MIDTETITLNRLSTLGLWLIGLPAGFILCYVARPTLELEGYWIGMVVGMTLTAASKLLIVLTFNWKKWIQKQTERLTNDEIFFKNPILASRDENVQAWLKLFDPTDPEN